MGRDASEKRRGAESWAVLLEVGVRIYRPAQPHVRFLSATVALGLGHGMGGFTQDWGWRSAQLLYQTERGSRGGNKKWSAEPGLDE